MEAAGNFVVVWEDDSQPSLPYYEIFARGYRFNSANQLEHRFSDIRVNTVTTGAQIQPDVAVAETLDFVVTWAHDETPSAADYDILARGYRINCTSTPTNRFSPIAVAAFTAGTSLLPAVEIDRLGNFFVAWQDDSDANGLFGIRARDFTSAGIERCSSGRVNTATPGHQLRPAIAVDGAGRALVVWEDDVNNNDAYQIVARGLSEPYPDPPPGSPSSPCWVPAAP
jgi:hypothetical protein